MRPVVIVGRKSQVCDIFAIKIQSRRMNTRKFCESCEKPVFDEHFVPTIQCTD